MVKAHALPMPGTRSSRCPGAVPGPVGVGHEVWMERLLEPLDLAVERLGLFQVALGLEPPKHVELGHVLDVVLLQQACDGVLGSHAALNEAQAGAEHVAQRAW